MLTATTSQRNHSKSPIEDVLETVACRRSKILTGVSFYHQYNVPSLCAVLTCGSPSTVDWTGSQQIFTIGRLGFCLYSTYLRFQLGRLLCLFHNNRSAVGRSVQYIKMWSRLNCWLVRVSPTKMSQLMADRWSVRYVPVASVQLLTLTLPIDVQVYSLVYWHLLSSLSCVSSPMWRLLWQHARMTCAQDPLPLPPHHPHNLACPLD